MSFQICGTCGEDFSGEDDYDDCDECAAEKICECEAKTGHKKTRKSGKYVVCAMCGVLV